MLPEIRLACLRMSGAFLCRQTKKPSADSGRTPQRAETKAEPSHSIAIYRTPPILAIQGDYAASRSVPKATVFRSVSCSS